MGVIPGVGVLRWGESEVLCGRWIDERSDGGFGFGSQGNSDGTCGGLSDVFPELVGERFTVSALGGGDVGGLRLCRSPAPMGEGGVMGLGLLLKGEALFVELPLGGVPSMGFSFKGKVSSVGLPFRGEVSSAVSLAVVARPSVSVRWGAVIGRIEIAPCKDCFFFSSSPVIYDG